MTLFIACLLIYHFNMDFYWYAIAVAIWMTHFGIIFMDRRNKK